jgi:hypothetical protein
MGSTHQNPDKVDADLLTAGGWQNFSGVEEALSLRRDVPRNATHHISARQLDIPLQGS